MINEFFKSIFRTLGRIFAYVLLGVLAYFILSWFGLPNVKADTINSSTYRIESITQSFGVGTSGNYVNGITIYNPTSDYGFQWLPVSGTSSSSWSYIPINSGSYSVDIQFAVGTTSQGVAQHFINTPPTLTMIVDRTTQATCDGTQTYSVIGNFTDTTNNYNVYWYSYRYQCSRLDVSSNFNNFMVRVLYGGLYNQTYTYLNYLTINATTLIDLNNITAGDQAIINSNNQNAQRIIDAMANVWNNVDEAKAAIEAMDQQLHSDMSRMITQAEQANIDMLAEITNEDDADADILFDGIEDLMPSNTPITNLISMPFTMYNSMLNGLNGTCSTWYIETGPLLGNSYFEFPCINLSRRLGSDAWTWNGLSLWNIIDFFGFIFLIYEIVMLMINGYEMIISLNDPWEELYVPQHGGFNTRSGRYYTEY